ncbi:MULTISPECIES: enoyl-CoA hydratase/isomerase family protein [unclassified Carboxylicivirga]|uniref:enoyl-CoA hydratase/isomerase family protein n=1 Tax=Carboxylicivirga TaxID=1628153 RepID=UPI003D35744F
MASSECNQQLVVVNQSKGVARILLNDPAKKNALSKEMINELLCVLDRVAVNDKLRLMVLRGADGMFCAGADLHWMKAGVTQSDEDNRKDAHLFYQLFEKLNAYPKPVIVWVEKYAMGGALGLLACADYVIAEKTVKMAFSEVRLGLVPATIAPFVINKIGLSQARALLLTGEVFSAKKAKRIGLIHEVLEAKEIPQRINRLCEQLSANSPSAMKNTKELLNTLSKHGKENEDKLLCIDKIAQARTSDEGQEGVRAFFEKRNPQWHPQKQ